MAQSSVCIVITNPDHVLAQLTDAYRQLWLDAGSPGDDKVRQAGANHLFWLFRLQRFAPGDTVVIGLDETASLSYRAPGLVGASDLKAIALTNSVAWLTFRDLFQKTFMVATTA